MDLPPVTTPTAPAPAATPEADKDAATSKSKISADFDTFLKMLTAQISNQDPMNPMNAEEFAVQLATFSNVEQQVRTNELLERMVESTGGGDLARISSWIGSDVRAQMPVRFDGAPITVDPETPVAGSTHQLVVRDRSGGEIHRQAIDATGAAVVWDGRARTGAAAPGVYAFSVESFENGALVATEPATTYGRVTEVRQTRDGPTLAFAGGIEVPAGDVTAIRAPGA